MIYIDKLHLTYCSHTSSKWASETNEAIMQLQTVAFAAKTIMILTKGFNYISVLKWYKIIQVIKFSFDLKKNVLS